MDVWYVENATLWLDAIILARTIFAVLGARGVTAEGHATMPPFEGSVLEAAAISSSTTGSKGTIGGL